MDTKGTAHLVASTIWLCGMTSCTLVEHHTTSDLGRELIEQSRSGLAMVSLVPNEPGLAAEFFDGRSEKLFPTLSKRHRELSVSRSRLLTIDDAPSPLAFDPIRDPSASIGVPLVGGPVVERDVHGNIIEQSDLWFRRASVSLSPDQERFALVSVLRGSAEAGLYVASFHDRQARKLASLANTIYTSGPFSAASMVDWSPDGESLLLSHQGTISLVDVRRGQSQVVAAGASALWSPSGEWISYVTSQWHPALLNLKRRQTKLIDPEKKIASTLEWSPDGKYLLIPEIVNPGSAPEFNNDALWIYRIRDGAWERFRSDVRFHSWHWIQLEERTK